mmetsp:Transcript_18421/g.57142  ORF Transcript_18421/g.57142 Transcript_18421/m.57142 type:complete len:367 (-) Transcript_18421:746-1846(-)
MLRAANGTSAGASTTRTAGWWINRLTSGRGCHRATIRRQAMARTGTSAGGSATRPTAGRSPSGQIAGRSARPRAPHGATSGRSATTPTVPAGGGRWARHGSTTPAASGSSGGARNRSRAAFASTATTRMATAGTRRSTARCGCQGRTSTLTWRWPTAKSCSTSSSGTSSTTERSRERRRESSACFGCFSYPTVYIVGTQWDMHSLMYTPALPRRGAQRSGLSILIHRMISRLLGLFEQLADDGRGYRPRADASLAQLRGQLLVKVEGHQLLVEAHVIRGRHLEGDLVLAQLHAHATIVVHLQRPNARTRGQILQVRWLRLALLVILWQVEGQLARQLKQEKVVFLLVVDLNVVPRAPHEAQRLGSP